MFSGFSMEIIASEYSKIGIQIFRYYINYSISLIAFVLLVTCSKLKNSKLLTLPKYFVQECFVIYCKRNIYGVAVHSV